MKDMIETVIQEKALLVMVEVEQSPWPEDALAREFRNLVVSTGIKVEQMVIMKRKEITPSLYIGKGKAEELALIVQEEDISVVIFNNNLKVSQQRNLEDVLGVKTIDRTQLILDIFAGHARTREGILQVELAQLNYLLPRLKGKGIVLSRLGGGIGTRGPGEKKLEIDRRRITDRITKLEKEINEVKTYRQVMRKKRQKEAVKMCSLIGYTNAGKTTLFNALTEGQEKTSPDLFTTLDTVTRQISLDNSSRVIVSDTVGFIYKLPANLVDAFKATLEELRYADVLLHIIDADNQEIPRLREAVDLILEELALTEKPALLVFNKIDRLSPDHLANLKLNYPSAVFVSAREKIDIDLLKRRIQDIFGEGQVKVMLKIPFNLMEVTNYIHNHCEILKKKYNETEVVYWVRADKNKLNYLRTRGVDVKKV